MKCCVPLLKKIGSEIGEPKMKEFQVILFDAGLRLCVYRIDVYKICFEYELPENVKVV